jgi:uncharacterized integral membrane protein
MSPIIDSPVVVERSPQKLVLRVRKCTKTSVDLPSGLITLVIVVAVAYNTASITITLFFGFLVICFLLDFFNLYDFFTNLVFDAQKTYILNKETQELLVNHKGSIHELNETYFLAKCRIVVDANRSYSSYGSTTSYSVKLVTRSLGNQAYWRKRGINFNYSDRSEAEQMAALVAQYLPSENDRVTASFQGAALPQSEDASTSSFDGMRFRLGWLALNVPLLWLFDWIPSILHGLDSTFGSNLLLTLWSLLEWIGFIPIALVQWLLLRSHLSKAYWWAIALVVLSYPGLERHFFRMGMVSLLDWGSFPLSSFILRNAIQGFIFGTLVGIVQWVVLQRSLSHRVQTARWIWISAIAWMIGLNLSLILTRWMPKLLSPFPESPYPLYALAELLSEGIGPLIFALITGSILSHWISISKTA